MASTFSNFWSILSETLIDKFLFRQINQLNKQALSKLSYLNESHMV